MEITDPDSGVALNYSAVKVAQKDKCAAEEWEENRASLIEPQHLYSLYAVFYCIKLILDLLGLVRWHFISIHPQTCSAPKPLTTANRVMAVCVSIGILVLGCRLITFQRSIC